MKLMEVVEEKYGQVDMVGSAYTMQITWVSERLEKLLGYQQGELVGQSVRKVVGLDASTMTRLIAGIMGAGGGKEDRRELLTKDGGKMMLSARLWTLIFEKEPYIVAKMIK